MNSIAVRRVGEFLDSWLAYRSRQVDIPGFSVAIWQGDGLIFSGAYGLANLETGQPMTTKHMFGIGSQSKMFTAVAILQLVQQRRLRLDDTIGQHLPWAGKQDAHLASVTIRQLLSHSSGLLRDGANADYWQLKRAFPTAKELQRSFTSSFSKNMDTSVKYSNVGYALLGQVIQAVTGQDYSRHISQHVLRPAGLGQTVPDFRPSIVGKLAKSYGAPYYGHCLPLSGDVPRNTFASVVGAYSTAEDMCRFAANLFFGNSQLVPDKLKTRAFSPHAVMADGYDKGTEFGLGFERMHWDEQIMIGHSGHITGYVTATYFNPSTKLAVSVMANGKNAPIGQMANGIIKTVDYFATHATKPISTRRARLNTRVFNNLASIEIVATNKSIVAIDPDDWSPFAWAEQLRQTTPNTLVVTTPGSVFNQGETVRYHFAKDVVQAVSYAGFTMLPEPAYRHSLQNNPEGKHLSLDDLQHTDVRIGRIVEVHVGAPVAPYRLVIDFGQFGRQLAYVQQLPPGEPRGQLLLGAVYPVWQSGKLVKTVVPLGTAPQQKSGSLLLPGSLLPLVADPSQPETLPNNLFWDRSYSYINQTKRDIFVFRLQPELRYSDIESPASLQAWLQGKYHKSKALLDAEAKQHNPWLERVLQRRLKSIVRVRAIDSSPTPYAQWEHEYYKRFNIPFLHETIFLLPQKKLANLTTTYNDLAIFDDNRVTVNGYSQNALTHGTFYDQKQGHEIQEFVRFKQRILKLAQQKGQRLQ